MELLKDLRKELIVVIGVLLLGGSIAVGMIEFVGFLAALFVPISLAVLTTGFLLTKRKSEGNEKILGIILIISGLWLIPIMVFFSIFPLSFLNSLPLWLSNILIIILIVLFCWLGVYFYGNRDKQRAIIVSSLLIILSVLGFFLFNKVLIPLFFYFLSKLVLGFY